jgi:two-component system sensor histidine kinase HydH
VIAVDNDGVIVRFNRAAAAILGYEGGDLIGKPFDETFDRPFAPKPHDVHHLRARSGRQVPVSERNSPVSDAEGNRQGRVKTFQDLSEIVALREQVRQVDRLAAIGEMAATVAHEIRNPLGGIRGFAAFLAEDIPEEDPRRRLVDKIQTGAQALEKVVNELLEYTRPVELNRRAVECTRLVASALDYLEYDAQRVTVRNDIAPDIKVRVDPDKVRQVVLNVLLNAVQSIPERGEVACRLEADDQYATLLVHDTGCGMPAETVASMFSPFFTTKEKGTGLGLAVSMKIIEGHGGEMSARSKPGAGTVVAIKLPRAE